MNADRPRTGSNGAGPIPEASTGRSGVRPERTPILPRIERPCRVCNVTDMDNPGSSAHDVHMTTQRTADFYGATVKVGDKVRRVGGHGGQVVTEITARGGLLFAGRSRRDLPAHCYVIVAR